MISPFGDYVGTAEKRIGRWKHGENGRVTSLECAWGAEHVSSFGVDGKSRHRCSDDVQVEGGVIQKLVERTYRNRDK